MRESFVEFFEADEVELVVQSFRKLLESAGIGSEVSGLDVFAQVCEKVEPVLPFKLKRIFSTLKEAVGKRQELAQSCLDAKVLVSGAGPVGLRAAVESALLGQTVLIVEKRSEFSRANVLMFWEQTMQDMVALGAKCFYPLLQTHGLLHMGTREIQLCLLKTALLLGADVRYETEIEVLCGTSDGWSARLKSVKKKSTKRLSLRNSLKGLKNNLKEAMSFKPNKTGDYRATYKCNMVDEPQVDTAFISGACEATEDEFRFDAMLVAEGEWSQTSRKLGFKKTVDRFNNAIGMVINMEYDRSNKAEKELGSFALGFSPVFSAVRDKLARENIHIEGIEYLKGSNHYIVATLMKESLLGHGVLKAPTTKGNGLRLLREENVDASKLEPFARLIAQAVGLPNTATFCEKNPIQLFDFSTRARAQTPFRLLCFDAKEGPQVLDRFQEDSVDQAAVIAPVMVIGDALIEPFWPQGLGSNRGFHSALDAVHAVTVLGEQGVEAFAVERTFSYAVMNAFLWKATFNLRPFAEWKTDPLSRYKASVVRLTVDAVEDKIDIPERARKV